MFINNGHEALISNGTRMVMHDYIFSSEYIARCRSIITIII